MSNETDGLTRRDFLKGSVATAAAIGIGSVGVFTHAQAEMIGPNDTINAAIIGIGSQGGILLERAIKAPNVKFVACCDIQPRNLKRALDIADVDRLEVGVQDQNCVIHKYLQYGKIIARLV